MKNKTVNYISYLIAGTLILGLVGTFIGIFNNNLNTSIKVLDVNGKGIANNSSYVMKFNHENVFTTSSKSPIKVEIKANNNYCFILDYQKVSFSTITQNLNSYFDLVINNNTFTIKPKYYVSDIVKSHYSDRSVTILNEYSINSDYFICRVSNGKEELKFKFLFDTPTGIEFDKGGIEF